jgi:hypothetical protein
MKAHKWTGVTDALRGLPEVAQDDIRAAFKSRGGQFATWTRDTRETLASAYTAVEDVYEFSKSPSKQGARAELRKRRRALENWVEGEAVCDESNAQEVA